MDPRIAHIERLRQWRGSRGKDLSLQFLAQQFKQTIEKPHKQLKTIIPLWQNLVPPDLAAHARLESLSRGVLRVMVDSSPHLYELDRLLRSGLQRELLVQHKGSSLRRVQLRLDERPISPQRPDQDD